MTARGGQRVVAVGDADMDIFLRVPHRPEADEKIRALAHHQCPGGMVANFAAALATLGTPCSFMGVVGDDPFGRASLADLERRGVDTSPTRIKPGWQTYYCTILLDPSGEKALVTAITDAMFPAPSDLDPAAIARASHLHTTAMWPPTALAAARHARASGVPVSLDLEADAIDAAGPQLDELLPLVDLLFMNERALARLLGPMVPPAEGARRAQELGPPTVVVTLGGAGVVVAHEREEAAAVPAHRVQVVDSTGAGDCFAAAFVHARLRGQPPLEAARFAAVAAALAVAEIGARTALPTREEVLTAMGGSRAA